MTLRVGIDTGGTFTDLVAFDEASGGLSFHKVASTPDDPSRAIVAGTGEIAGGDAVDLLVHGTTVATNTVLQRAGARAALITTAGFRDVLHIQRQDRPRMYDLRSRRARPLIPRQLRLELTERMLYDGSVQTPIDHDQLGALIEQLKREQVEAVVVGLLHSYANPAHEIEVGRVLREQLPGATVCLSHELVGEHGEYERFSTAAMNGYVQPVMQRYLTNLGSALKHDRIAAPLFVMKSNGGVMSADAAGRQCVQTILSGPAGGVVCGAAIANHHTNRNLITADMGGTSFDVAVIHDGRVAFARDSEMAGLAIGVPMLDIHTVGAGGGSIGWIDAGGSLRVGPRSAGADPGPACYGRGGDEPTVTDANLLLGRLAPATLLGGAMRIDVEASRRAIHDRLATPMGLSVEDAAEGVIRVVNATMTAAIRKLTVERGHDPRKFAMCPFGGAGPLHGAELAAETGISETVIPLAPGVNSALGLLMSNLREDRIRTFVRLLDDTSADELEAVFSELHKDAAQRLDFAAGEARRALGMRYLGQRYELPVTVTTQPIDLAQVAADFHAEHERQYGFSRSDQSIEISSAWLSLEVDLQAVHLPLAPASRNTPPSTRSVVFRGQPQDTPVFSRDAVPESFRGPAIVEQLDATTVVWPGQPARVDDYGQLILGAIP